MKKHLLRIPAILLALLIFIVSSLPLKQVELQPVLSFDKILHIIEYMIFGFSVGIACVTFTDTILSEKLLTSTIIISSLYAASDEIHQAFVSGRHCSILDWLADVVGILIGAYILKKSGIVEKIGYDIIE